jgi:hypothetical protein
MPSIVAVISQAHAKLGRGSNAPISSVVLTVNGTLLVDNALTLKEDNKLVWDDIVHYECSSSDDDGAGVLSITSSIDDAGMQHYTIHIYLTSTAHKLSNVYIY